MKKKIDTSNDYAWLRDISIKAHMEHMSSEDQDAELQKFLEHEIGEE